MSDSDLNLLAVRIQSLHEDVGDIKGTLQNLTAAITKLALVEERLSVTMAAQERAFTAIASVERRLSILENKVPVTDNAMKWVDRGITAIVAAAIMFVWEKVTKG